MSKVVFIISNRNFASLCVPWTTKTVVAAQQVVQRRQDGGRIIAMVAQLLPWSLNGGIVVATVIVQWMLLVGQKRLNGGTRQAEASLKLIHNVNNSTPMADHCPSSLRPQRCRCLPPMTCERPTPSPTFVRLFWTCSKLHGDHGVHGEVWSHKGGTKIATPV